MSALKYWDNIAAEWRYVTVPLIGQPVATYSWAGSVTNGVDAADYTSRETLMEQMILYTSGKAVEAIFDCSGYVYTSSGNTGASVVQLEYSEDGGATWLDDNSSRQIPESLSGQAFSGFSLHGRYAGTPTSDLRVRLTGYHHAGTTLVFHGPNTELVAQIFFAAPVMLDNHYQVASDTGWISATMLNGWANYNSASFAPGRYRKKNGVVYVEGFLDPTSSTSITAFVLPEGYRPDLALYLPAISSDSSATNTQVRFSASSGTVQPANYGSGAAWVGFAHSFPVG